MESHDETMQMFVVTVQWSPESSTRLTEMDIREVVEGLALEVDTEATVEVVEKMDQSL